ncbi:hypothetical protein Bbelb_145340 [Branchiostoma belcheri]|nr:hypothetical protein Bbelb_145340 [Branchiostoma belcheri]
MANNFRVFTGEAGSFVKAQTQDGHVSTLAQLATGPRSRRPWVKITDQQTKWPNDTCVPSGHSLKNARALVCLQSRPNTPVHTGVRNTAASGPACGHREKCPLHRHQADKLMTEAGFRNSRQTLCQLERLLPLH